MTKELLVPVFSSQLHSKFRVHIAAPNTIDFELIEVEPRPSPDGYECFSIKFRAPLNVPIEQRTYRFEHDEVPAMDMFVVPIAKEENGVIFESVFNRLVG